MAAARSDDDENPERKSDRFQFYIVTGRVFSDAGLVELDETNEERAAQRLFEKKKELIPYCRGFYRDIYKTIIVADLQKKDNEAAKAHWTELKAGMQKHYDYYQTVLASDEEQAKFTARQIERMRTYTKDYIEDKQEAILQIIKQFFGNEAYSLLAD